MARTNPAVLEFLADGVSLPGAAIVAALAGRQAKGDVVRTLMRLAVDVRVVGAGEWYALAAAATDPVPDPG